jgi:hypothetical protein
MNARVGPHRIGRSFLLASLAALAISLGLGAAQAGAAVSLTPTTQGSGSIVTNSVTNGSPIYGGCFNTGFRDDRVVFGCPGQGIAGATTCVLGIICGVPIDSALVLLAVPNALPTGHWSFVQWQGCDAVAGNLCTILNPGTITNSRSPRAIFNDSVGPTVTAASVAHSTTTDRGVSFTGLGGNETLSAVNCRVDASGSFAPCSQVRQFAEGTHQVFAQGTDLSGNVGGVSAALATFRIVDTTLVSGPADFSTVKRPTFTYSTLAGQNFECSIDSTTISTPCGTKDASGRASFTPPADLPDGEHKFRVEAIDGPDFDRVPVVRTWTVDTVAPNTTLLSPDLPEGVLTTLLNAAFTFTSSEPVGATFQCRLAPAADFSACTSPQNFTDLAFGRQKFEVRTIDRAGNVDATPAVRNWEIAAADNDSDGFNQRSDCNDSDPAINPGRPEINDNGVDENCDGTVGVTPPPPPSGGGGGGGGGVAGEGAERILIAMPFAFSKSTKKFTIFTVLQIKAIPIGSTLKVTCKAPKGKKCPGGKSFTKKNAFGTVKLKKWTNKKLLAGTKLTATVTKPGNFIGAVKIMTVRPKNRPKFTDRCIAPGTTKAVGC